MYLFLYETVFLQLFRSLSLSQDLTFVQIGNPDLIDGKINFAKRWQQFNILVSSGVRTAEFSSQKFFRCCKQSSQNGFQLQIVKLKTRPTLTQHICSTPLNWCLTRTTCGGSRKSSTSWRATKTSSASSPSLTNTSPKMRCGLSGLFSNQLTLLSYLINLGGQRE